MAWNANILTSIVGRRLGLQRLTTAQTVSVPAEVMVGPEAYRSYATTADTTATYMTPYGISVLSSGNSASATPVFRLAPPIPGVEKTIVILSTAAGVASTSVFYITLSTGGAEAMRSSWSSSFTVMATSTPVTITLRGASTSIWAVANSSAACGLCSTTT